MLVMKLSERVLNVGDRMSSPSFNVIVTRDMGPLSASEVDKSIVVMSVGKPSTSVVIRQ